MKAIVKETGDIIEVAKESMIYAENFNKSYNIDEIEILNDEQENRIIPIELPVSYWDQLKHQYAGMFLQGMIIGKPFIRDYVEDAYKYATALVNSLKEEEK